MLYKTLCLYVIVIMLLYMYIQQLQPTSAHLLSEFHHMRKTIFLIAILNSFLFFRLSIFYNLPARSVDDFISLTNATRKNPHEWRTPLINALLSNIEKQMRKACKLSFVNPCGSFSVLFDSSSSHKRAFSLFAILKMGFVALCFSAK